MTRKEFLQLSALTLASPLLGAQKSTIMPALFVGHGSPMNILADNSYTTHLKDIAKSIPKPKAIVVISAHWYQEKTYISGSNIQECIYDFYGFPDELYDIKYTPKGDPRLADELHSKIFNSEVVDRGVDHGTWSVLHHMYPNQDIPTLQISINKNLSYLEYYKLGSQLSYLRENGVLVMGSGNITHNLRAAKRDESATQESWAVEFDEYVKESFDNKEFYDLINAKEHKYFAMSHPFDDHFIPLLYIAGLVKSTDTITHFHQEIQNANISMRCIKIG